MSANIYYQIIKPKYLPVSLSSNFIAGLKNAFGELPVKLNKNNIERLEGMAALNSDYRELVSLLDKYDEIEVWAEY